MLLQWQEQFKPLLCTMNPRVFVSEKELWKLLPLAVLPFLLYWGLKAAQLKSSEVPIEELNHEVQQSLPIQGTYASVIVLPKNWSWNEGYSSKARWSVPVHEFFDARRDVQVRRRTNGSMFVGPPAKIALILQLVGDTADPIGQIQIDWFQSRSVIQSISTMSDDTAKAFNSRFASYELTPESRRKILQLINKRYGKQLRALRIPPPQ